MMVNDRVSVAGREREREGELVGARETGGTEVHEIAIFPSFHPKP